MEAGLAPRQGNRFQPTGFADIGAATYLRPDGKKMLLVDSAQSMANRLERAITGPDGEIVPELVGLPYVRTRLKGLADVTTTSLIEAHRINSPWIMDDKKFKEKLLQEMGLKGQITSINWQKVARTIFKYDVNSILHGAFLVSLDPRLKMPRALSAFIEAENVWEAVSGGTKFDHVDPTGKKIEPENREKTDVLGNVPFQRVEYTAEAITAYFNLDLGLLRSYDLGKEAFELLAALCLYKIRVFLEDGTRLRTACDLKLVGEPRVTEPAGLKIPDKQELLRIVRDRIGACKGMFASPPVTEISSKAVAPKKKGKGEEEEESMNGDET